MLVGTGVQTCRINLCVSCNTFCNGRTSKIRHHQVRRRTEKNTQRKTRFEEEQEKQKEEKKQRQSFTMICSHMNICGSKKGWTPAHTFGMEMHSPRYKYKVIQARHYCKPENVVIRCQWMWLSQGVERIQKPLVVSATYKSYDQKTPLIALDCFVLWNASRNWGPDL